MVVLVILIVSTLVVLTFLFGFHLASRSDLVHEQWRIRRQAAVAARELHQVTRDAFVAMAEAAERQRRNDR
jgi:cell division protein FtsB